MDSQRPHAVETGCSNAPAAVLLSLATIVVGAVLLAHWPVLFAQALSLDDSQYLVENHLVQAPGLESSIRFVSEVRAPSTVQGYYQPLAMISLMLDYAMGGRPENLRPFHRTSLTLHVANTVLIIVFLHLLFGSPPAAAAAGLLFGVHPITVEPVAWVGDRKTLLATLFALTALIAYVRYARISAAAMEKPPARLSQIPRWGWYSIHTLCFILALMSKPTTTPLPLALLVLDYWPLKRLSRGALTEKLPLAVIAGVSAVITYVSQKATAGVYNPADLSVFRVPLILCHNVWLYLQMMLWPVDLPPHYPIPDPMDLTHPAVLAGVLGTLALFALLLASLRWTRAVLAGWLFFFFMILPTMGIVGFTRVIAASKFAYLPSLGMLMLLTLAFRRLSTGTRQPRRTMQRQATVLGVVLAVCTAEIAETRRQLSFWKDSETLSRRMVSTAPEDSGAHSNLGTALAMKGRTMEALTSYTEALRLDPGNWLACYGLGNLYAGAGNYEPAIDLYTRGIGIAPGDALLRLNRGNTYLMTGQYDRAIADYDTAIRMRPACAEGYNNRGFAYGRKGNFEQAVHDFTQAIQLKPDYAQAYGNRAAGYLSINAFDKAWADVRRCRSLGGTPEPAVLRALVQATSQTP